MKLRKTAALVKPGCEASFRRHFEGLTDPEQGGMTVVVAGESVEGGLDPSTCPQLGRRYLGVGVGSNSFRREFVKRKVVEWVETLRSLSKLARVLPHEAYCLLAKSVIPSWRYAMRTMPVGSDVYQPLEEALVESFFPACFGWSSLSEGTRMRAALPLRHGGLAIPDPCELARTERRNASWATWGLTQAILDQSWTTMWTRRRSARPVSSVEQRRTCT